MFSTTSWFLQGNFSKEKYSVIVIKTRKSHHMTKFLIICNNPRIASTKTQSKFLQYHVFCERRKFRKRRTSHDIKIEILEFSWSKNSFQKLMNLWKQPKGRKISKNCQERGDRSLISHPSLFKIRVTLSETRSFLWQIITSDIWN